jgi:ATP-dependent Clp protease ATP-binding subunit ClpA
MVFMTSNLGAEEMGKMLSGGLGFASGTSESESLDAVDQKIYRTALGVARKKFTPEFMNRIDKIVVFRTLSRAHLRQIVDLELDGVRERVLTTQPGRQFILHCTDRVKEFLVDEGTDRRYGARHLKRAIERYLVFPLSNLIATEQIGLGDVVWADLDVETGKLCFTSERAAAVIGELAERPMFEEKTGEDSFLIRAAEVPIPAAGKEA